MEEVERQVEETRRVLDQAGSGSGSRGYSGPGGGGSGGYSGPGGGGSGEAGYSGSGGYGGNSGPESGGYSGYGGYSGPGGGGYGGPGGFGGMEGSGSRPRGNPLWGGTPGGYAPPHSTGAPQTQPRPSPPLRGPWGPYHPSYPQHMPPGWGPTTPVAPAANPHANPSGAHPMLRGGGASAAAAQLTAQVRATPLRLVPTPGICSLLPCDWFQPLEYARYSPAIAPLDSVVMNKQTNATNTA
eukprot:25484-Prorocentrum_minimum.AAC.1